MDEMDVQPVDLGDELRQGIEPRFHLAPVVVTSPIAGEVLDRRELHALRRIGDGFAVGPFGGGDTPAKLGELLLGEADGEGTDGLAARRRAQRLGKQADSADGSRGGKKFAPCWRY